MTGLTTRQAWCLQHIARCSCGSWQVITHVELVRRAEGFPPAPCPHIRTLAMEAS
jgi:hypothetical protein